MAAWHVAVTVAPFHAPEVGGPAVAVFGAQYFFPVSYSVAFLVPFGETVAVMQQFSYFVFSVQHPVFGHAKALMAVSSSVLVAFKVVQLAFFLVSFARSPLTPTSVGKAST
jgi:hypothetical protein